MLNLVNCQVFKRGWQQLGCFQKQIWNKGLMFRVFLRKGRERSKIEKLVTERCEASPEDSL